MILYELRCSNNHQFEAWFRDGATYEFQAAAGEVECPFCGANDVRKAPMAPRIVNGRTTEDSPSQAPGADGGHDHADEVMREAAATVDHAERVAREILDAFRRLRTEVEKSCDYVGERFAEEARRIHFGDADERGIYGEATREEVEELVEEGVEIGRLPWPTKRDS